MIASVTVFGKSSLVAIKVPTIILTFSGNVSRRRSSSGSHLIRTAGSHHLLAYGPAKHNSQTNLLSLGNTAEVNIERK